MDSPTAKTINIALTTANQTTLLWKSVYQKSISPTYKKKAPIIRFFSWWEGVDSYNSEVWHLCAKHFAPPPRRWFVQYIVLQLHQRCSKSTTLTYKKKAPIIRCFSWWEGVDSNHRSHWQQIYSLLPLATREPSQMELVTGIEPATCWLQISCSAYWATLA